MNSSTDDHMDPLTYSGTIYVGIIATGRVLPVYVLTSPYNCINCVTACTNRHTENFINVYEYLLLKNTFIN